MSDSSDPPSPESLRTQQATQLDVFFQGRPDARTIFAELQRLITAIGHSTIRVTRSQVAFTHRRAFAWAWTPDRYLSGRGAPLVLSIALSHRDPSPRWKEVVQPRPGHWMHHLELNDQAALDQEVINWLTEAHTEAS